MCAEKYKILKKRGEMQLIKWYHVAAVIHGVLLSSAQEQVVCPENLTPVSNKCIYQGFQTDWFTAVKKCHQAEANITLINTKINELREIVSVFLKQGIKSLWIEAKRSTKFGPITYQLPSSSYYGKSLLEPENSFTEGVITNWMENEPALNEEYNCMVLKLGNTTNGTSELHAKLDKCDKSVHSFVCITYPCANQDVRCSGLNTKLHRNKGLEHGILSPPKLEIRKENNKYFLEVYIPENFWDFSNSSKKIRNPVCVIEDGDQSISNICDLDQKRVLSWTSQNRTLRNKIQYSITKAVFRIISENEGYVICRAFVAETMNEIVTKRQLFRSEVKSHIFAVSLLYRMKSCLLKFCEPTYSLEYWQSLAQNLSQKLQTNKEFKRLSVRLIKMADRAENNITLIFRIKITSKIPAGDFATDRKYLNYLRSGLQFIASNNTDGPAEILYVRSSKFCHDEEGKKTLHWPVATIAQTVLPIELCISGEGVPVQRHCSGDFIVGAFWSDENEDNVTYQCEVPSPRTTFLHKLSLQVERKENATNTLKKLECAFTSQDTKKFGNITHFTPADIQYAANTLSRLQDNILHDSDLPIIANITDAILRLSATNSDNNVIKSKMRQRLTNASNIILESVDNMLNKIKLNYKETSLVVTPSFVTLVMDINTNSRMKGGLQGLAALKSSKYPDKYFKKQDIITLSGNDSLDTLLAMEVSTAVLLPQQFILQSQTEDACDTNYTSLPLKTCNSTQVLGKQKPHRLVINLFWDDGLFASNNARIRMPYHVLSVALDGVKQQDLISPLILVFDSARDILSQGRECVFWDFQANAGLGNWSDIGCTPAVRLDENESVNTDVCVCTHLTHFGQLLSPLLEEEVNTTLDMITIIGCSISLLGLFGIAVTALVFPDWRRGASKKIQLHLSASLAILMSVFLLNAFLFKSSNEIAVSQFCLVLGAMLHFSLMATFCWMLVAAWFQFLRLTKPLASLRRSPHILLKTAVFAWGFPLIPCGALLIASPDSYNSPQCYPTGIAHYLSVIAPISIIVSLNIAMFILIVCSIYKLGNFGVRGDCELQYTNTHRCKRRIAYRRLSTLVFLFFLLGLSWIFGIWKLSYLFCSTATLQGFAFFVFFVVLEKNTRAKWSHLFTKKKCDTIHPLCNSNSSGSVLKRWSYGYKRTSRNTLSTLSSLS